VPRLKEHEAGKMSSKCKKNNKLEFQKITMKGFHSKLLKAMLVPDCFYKKERIGEEICVTTRRNKQKLATRTKTSADREFHTPTRTSNAMTALSAAAQKADSVAAPDEPGASARQRSGCCTKYDCKARW
jgi:hypothetical protein